MNRILLLVICFIFVATGMVHAEPTKVHNFEMGSETYYYLYEEPDIMENEGAFYGILGSYVYHNEIMLAVDGRFAFGQVDYTSNNTGSIDDIDDYVFEARGLIGYDFTPQTFTVTPYIGFGYRYLNDDMAGLTSSTGHWGYERESNYYYSPIGVETITELKDDWSLGLILEYDLFWKGEQKSNLGDVAAGYNNISNDQNDGYGFRGSIKIQKKTEKIDFLIEPFIRYWNIKKSEDSDLTYQNVVIAYGYEPKNNTLEYGLKLALKY